jgi:hypothetical protein
MGGPGKTDVHLPTGQTKRKGNMSMAELREAVDFYSGGVRTASGPRWSRVSSFLDEHGYTPYEYCWFCVHRLSGRYEPGCFQKVNLITCDSTMEAFLDFKKDREKEIQERLQYCRFTYLEMKRLFGPDMILTDDRMDMDPAIRCDLALKDMVDPSPVLEQFGEAAHYELLGNPEMIPHLKHFKLSY